jgi:hypothetical protein
MKEVLFPPKTIKLPKCENNYFCKSCIIAKSTNREISVLTREVLIASKNNKTTLL